MTEELIRRLVGPASSTSAEIAVRRVAENRAHVWTTATDSLPGASVFRNVWCGVKPAWLLAIDHLVRTGTLAYQDQIAIGDGVDVSLLDLLAGTTFGLAEPSALAIRTTPPQERDSLVRSALNSGRRSDAHSEVSFSWIAREIVRSRAAESESAVVTKAMHEAGLRDVHLYPLLALETGQLALSDIQPTAVEVNGTQRLSYHDRTAVVCGDPDFALTCGLSSADGLAQLGLALIHSPLASMLERYLDTVGRIHGAGILHRPSLGGYPQLSDDWRLVIGWQASGVLAFNRSLGLSVGFTCGESITAAADKQLLAHQLTCVAREVR